MQRLVFIRILLSKLTSLLTIIFVVDIPFSERNKGIMRGCDVGRGVGCLQTAVRPHTDMYILLWPNSRMNFRFFEQKKYEKLDSEFVSSLIRLFLSTFPFLAIFCVSPFFGNVFEFIIAPIRDPSSTNVKKMNFNVNDPQS